MWCRGVLSCVVPTLTVTRTYLEMTAPEQLHPAGAAGEGVRLEEVHDCPWHFYRYLYTEGGRLSHWRDRLPWTEQQFRDWLAGPSRIWVLTVRGAPAGFFELRGPEAGGLEIAYLGVLPEHQGAGLGKFLLTRAVEEAWVMRPTRVWLHTCTLDHPGALPNYLKRGFRPVREEQYETSVP